MNFLRKIIPSWLSLHLPLLSRMLTLMFYCIHWALARASLTGCYCQCDRQPPLVDLSTLKTLFLYRISMYFWVLVSARTILLPAVAAHAVLHRPRLPQALSLFRL